MPAIGRATPQPPCRLDPRTRADRPVTCGFGRYGQSDREAEPSTRRLVSILIADRMHDDLRVCLSFRDPPAPRLRKAGSCPSQLLARLDRFRDFRD